MREIALTLLIAALAAGCGNGLAGLNNENGGSNGLTLVPVDIYIGKVTDATFGDSVGSSLPPTYISSSGGTALSGATLNNLINIQNTTPYTYNTGASCSGAVGPFAVMDFVFDVGNVNLGSYNNIQITLNGVAAGYNSSSASAGPNGSGTGGMIEVYDGSTSSWNYDGTSSIPGGSNGIGQVNFTYGASTSNPLSSWIWEVGTEPYILVSLRSTNCTTSQFSAITLNNIQLNLQ